MLLAARHRERRLAPRQDQAPHQRGETVGVVDVEVGDHHVGQGGGSTAASRSFWIGLPPQSTRTASLRPRTRARCCRDGATEARWTCRGTRSARRPPLRLAGAPEQERDGHDRGGDAEHAHHLGDPERPEHQGIGADPLGHEAAERVEADVGEEQRPGARANRSRRTQRRDANTPRSQSDSYRNVGWKNWSWA